MELQTILGFISVAFIAYLVGSFPTGYLLVKIVKNVDIREVGSHSIGATNVKRVMGKKGFFIVMLFDILKGMLPVYLAKYVEIKFNLYPDLHILPIIVALAIIIGHSKSIFLGFNGGKSVASGAGTIGGLCFVPIGMILITVWSLTSYFSKYISLASIITLALAPILMMVFKQPWSYTVYCAVAAIYVIYLHRENIKRLLNGTENKVRN